ncbi:RNA polymerase sigma factor [Biformimicrobium ophioploci]|uniref:RNA polymerase sigma factor n=1 Tax=Biformimicrobium ophioploci TaxID=3036711 RepID=A0ABQ6LZV8_9GAMM|nr:sigma-70 family RNA polymerase sigma factor [Microbulbifer sp. NKW57]GMG87633.1 RNA polymerase sigma factor [Microbulbifer sp. NKW57]
MNETSALEKNLIARALAQQDARAFGELVKLHQSRVRNFLRKMARDEALADDIAQDSFMLAWKKLHTFSGQGSFIGWLLKIAYNTFLQSKRKSGRYDEVLQQLGHQPADEATSVNAEAITDLDKYLAILSEQERAIMTLSYACGLSHREVSDTANLPLGTVKSLIARSKEKIRAKFQIQHHQHQ